MGADDFERLYEAHADSLFGFLAYRTGDPMLAEDLLADTFERVIKGRRSFNPRKASEKTWIYTIALNLLRDHQRRTAAEERASTKAVAAGERFAAGGAPADEVAERADLMAALEALTTGERETIALRYGGDMSLAEISRATGQKAATVEGRLYRGLRKLREQLD